MIVEALRKLVEGNHLSEEEAAEVMTAIMDGQTTHAQIGALLAALRMKRETVDELTGFARVMRGKSVHVHPRRRPLVDIVGTGGDTCDTFNISTTAAFVIAAAGIAVAKHGNRAISGRCGSADVLEALGVALDLTPARIAECIDEVGVGFMFAPSHHPAMKNVGQPRRELGIRTVFNVLGPLTNPAGATRQIVGVFDPDLCARLAAVLGRLGCERAMVVHGLIGLDEISTVGETVVSCYEDGVVREERLTPEALGVPAATVEQLAGGDNAEENAAIVRGILAGETGPRRDIVVVNAAAGLRIGGAAGDWSEALSLAGQLIDSGKATAVLDSLVALTRTFKQIDG